MLSLSGLGKFYGDRALFTNVTLRLDVGCRYGLVGANGSGKTTLLHILAGDEPYNEGEITAPKGMRIGVLKQDRYLNDEQRIIDVAMMGDHPVWHALTEKNRLLNEHSTDAAAIADVEEKIAIGDGYTLESRAAAVLEGLGIAGAAHPQALSTLSGGFKLRVLFAQTLLSRPDLLLLDEPTNHLDILTVFWLERFLASYKGCAVIVSHDHRFLDTVTTHILDVDYEAVTSYPGSYSHFVTEKAQTRERQESAILRKQQIVAQKKAFVERFQAKATKARQAQSRIKQINKIEIEEVKQSSRRAPLFRFEQQRRSGRDVLKLNAVSKSFGDNVVLRDITLSIRRGERVALIGANGLGKSTLLKILVDELEADNGTADWGYEVHIGYFPQDHSERLSDKGMSALDFLWKTCPMETTSFVRGQLGQMLFSGSDVEKKLQSLSGGESARLIFSELVVAKPNMLVLDEPTNHLDIEAIESLADALINYAGTLIFVSHDRWFVSRLATRVIEITPTGYNDYPGSYQDYLADRGDDYLDAGQVVAKARKQKGAANRDGASDDWEAQKRRRSNERKLRTSHKKVTEAIAACEARLDEIKKLYAQPNFFTDVSSAEVEALDAEDRELQARTERLLEEWEGLETQLEALSEA